MGSVRPVANPAIGLLSCTVCSTCADTGICNRIAASDASIFTRGNIGFSVTSNLLSQLSHRRHIFQPELLAAGAILCFSSIAFSQNNLERPVALVLAATNAEKRSAGEEAWHRVKRGVQVFRGDSLRGVAGQTAFAFCPSLDGETAGTLLTLNAGETVDFGAQATTPSLVNDTRLPVCLLPLMERSPTPSTQDDPDTRTALPGTLDARLQNLPSGMRASLVPKLQLADAMIQQQDLSIVGRASRAALLETVQLDRDALTVYRDIRDSTPDANWTAQVIERLTRSQLSRGTPVLNSSITLPSASPRVVGDPKALRLPGSEINPEKGQTYALVLGISTYNALSGVTNLKYADRDALSFRDYLKSARGGGLPDDHIWLLLNEEATRDKLDFELTEFAKGKAGADNTLIVFVASHGAYACKRQDLTYEICESGDENEEAVILVRESDPQNPKLTGFPMARLRQLITDRASDFGRVVLYIDACHSGNVRDPPPGGLALPARKATKALQSSSGQLGIMMASSVEDGQRNRELAYEDDDLKHGIFTYFLLSGLNGEVKPTGESVYFDQLFNHVSQKVTSFTDVKQAPDRFRSRSTLKVVDHAAIEGARILDTAPALISAVRAPRSVGQTDADTALAQALASKKLLPPASGNASDALEQLRIAVGETSPLYQLGSRQLRVALEEQGQLIILKYLQGDQVTQSEADFRQCSAYFQRALDFAPDAAFDRSRLRFCEGRTLIFQKDYVRAAERLEQAIRLDPGHSYARNALGIAYLEQVPTDANFFQPAVAAFRDAIRLSPYWAYPRHNLSLTLTQRGAYAEAEAQYVAAMRLAPRYSYLPYNAGLLQQQLNRLEEARAYYKNAIVVAEGRCADRFGSVFTTCPERSAPLTALATVTGRRAQAIRLFQSAIRDDPSDVTARHDFAVLLSNGKSTKRQAESLWKDILAQQPHYLPALLAYSDFLKHERRFAECIPIYQTILTLRAGYLPVSIDFATALTMSGRPADALEMLENLITTNPENPGLFSARAQALDALGQKERARQDRRQSRDLRKRF